MELFAEISVLIAIATVVAVVMRLLHQPLIIGHILTGLIVGPVVFDLVRSAETLALMGEIGVAILLFTVGLHLSPDIIRKFGKVSFITGIGQVLFTAVVGYFVAEKDVQVFLLASVSLLLASFAGIQGFATDVTVRGLTVSGITISKSIISILVALLFFYVPATIIVALKVIFSLAKR